MLLDRSVNGNYSLAALYFFRNFQLDGFKSVDTPYTCFFNIELYTILSNQRLAQYLSHRNRHSRVTILRLTNVQKIA